MPPLYKSEATVLIETGELDLTRPSAGGSDAGTILDQEAIASQVQLIRSRDLAAAVAGKLDLEDPPRVRSDAGSDIAGRPTSSPASGLARTRSAHPSTSGSSQNFFKKLEVYAIDKSRVIAIEFSSTRPEARRRCARMRSPTEYIALQRAAKRDVNADATKWLEAEIDDLRVKVKDAEAKVETFRAQNDLFSQRRPAAGDAAATAARRPQHRAYQRPRRARRRRGQGRRKSAPRISTGAALEPIRDVLNSPLIQRLVEQQVALRAQIAAAVGDAAAGHPRMRELSAQLADLDRQVASEAAEDPRGLEAEAQLSRRARREIISEPRPAEGRPRRRANDAEVELRALEREAAAQRDLLDTYLRRYREALARQKGDYLPADARDHFPRRGADRARLPEEACR